MSTEEHKAVVRRYYAEIASAEPTAAALVADDLLSPDFVFFGPNDTEGERGRESHKQFLAWHASVIPDQHWRSEELIATDDRVVSRWLTTGTQQGEFLGLAPSGKPLTLHGVDIFEMADGKIASLRRYFDVLTVMQQWGGVPAAVAAGE